MPVVLVLASGESSVKWKRPLASAGWNVEYCSARKIMGDCNRQNTAAKRAAQTEGKALQEPVFRLESWRPMVRSILQAGVDIMPALKAAAVVVAEPRKEGFRRLAVSGRQIRTFPVVLLAREHPLLRVAMEKKKAIYIPDNSILSGRNAGGHRGDGCFYIPVPADEPMGVFCLVHAGGETLAEPAYAIARLMAQELGTVFQNASLQSRLNASELRYRSILSAAPFLIALVDSSGSVLEINPQLVCELKRQGISPRRAKGANVLNAKVLPEELRILLETSLHSGQGFTREEISLLLPRGPELLRLHVVPLRSGYSAGELLVIAEIITHYHQLMEEAERNERLAAIGRVAASLAHEVNNPLQALRSHLELIRSYPLSEDEREQSFRILEREVERLDETTRRVLGFARPAPDILQPVSILGILDQALALSRSYLQNQQINIHTNFPDDLPPVMAAAGQLIQVFLNIILNAAHAMQGCGILELRAGSLGDAVEIVFSNDGPPIPPEQLPHIFEPFFTTHPEGTGLGLSISHAILQRHNGTIRAENLTQRRGVAFTITLPFTPKKRLIGYPHG